VKLKLDVPVYKALNSLTPQHLMSTVPTRLRHHVVAVNFDRQTTSSVSSSEHVHVVH